MRYAPTMRAMTIVIAGLAVFSVTVLAQPLQSERDAVLKTVQAFFDTMTARDVEGARKVLQPQGRFHAMRLRNGKPDVREFSNEEYFATLLASKQKMQERIWNPEVRIHGLIATVWAPYDFWIDGKFSHCGVDAFDLIKTDEGWKLAGGVYTLDEKCDPSPLGPLKP
jgi:Putative lumazine-binding